MMRLAGAYSWRLPVSLLVLALAAGCARSPILVQQYILEYPSPAMLRQPQVPEAIKVQQFSVAAAYHTTAMLYRVQPNQRQAYQYHRWRITPGPLVTDCLVQDLRGSGLFKAVFHEDAPDRARFRVEGGVSEILEDDTSGTWNAVLGLHITLLDTRYPASEIRKRLVFQKSYRAEEPLPEKTPQGLAQGMSRAMSRLSQQIIADLYQAAQERMAAKEP